MSFLQFALASQTEFVPSKKSKTEENSRALVRHLAVVALTKIRSLHPIPSHGPTCSELWVIDVSTKFSSHNATFCLCWQRSQTCSFKFFIHFIYVDVSLSGANEPNLHSELPSNFFGIKIQLLPRGVQCWGGYCSSDSVWRAVTGVSKGKMSAQLQYSENGNDLTSNCRPQYTGPVIRSTIIRQGH